jgi:hypothetical protein
MKKISGLFSDEEKKQLSYLGSMLRREAPTAGCSDGIIGSRVTVRRKRR